ncbi:tetratricopeptide repeat protein [Caulobacter sp. DWR1-3-2b1]|uniref:tetratricopeptide repeat protein n=1 Tax=Caulobacter sp. DWR1-3-2b1 TaxID=2804670 RepID=UPI003CF7F33E
MCRKRALLATVLAPALMLLGAQAHAGAAKNKPEAVEQTTSRKATPTQRAEMRRADPLARAAFWGGEFETDSRDAEAGVALAQALRALGRYDDAAATVAKVLMAQPDNIDALLESARAQIARGQGFYAIDPARRAAALAPRDWRPQSLLGVAYEQAQRDDEASVAHRQAVALAPNEAVPTANYAMHLASQGDLAGAEAQLRRAAVMPASSIQIRQNLALVIGLQGRIAEAEKLARQDLPPESVANNLAWLRAATSKPGPAGQSRSWDAMKSGG